MQLLVAYRQPRKQVGDHNGSAHLRSNRYAGLRNHHALGDKKEPTTVCFKTTTADTALTTLNVQMSPMYEPVQHETCLAA